MDHIIVHGCTTSALSKLRPCPKVISWLCLAGHSCCHGSAVRVCKPRQKPKHLQPGLQHQVNVITRMGQICQPEKRVLHLPHQGLCELTAVVCLLHWQICRTYSYSVTVKCGRTPFLRYILVALLNSLFFLYQLLLFVAIYTYIWKKRRVCSKKKKSFTRFNFKNDF